MHAAIYTEKLSSGKFLAGQELMCPAGKYTIFAQVIDGLDVLDKMEKVPTGILWLPGSAINLPDQSSEKLGYPGPMNLWPLL